MTVSPLILVNCNETTKSWVSDQDGLSSYAAKSVSDAIKHSKSSTPLAVVVEIVDESGLEVSSRLKYAPELSGVPVVMIVPCEVLG